MTQRHLFLFIGFTVLSGCTCGQNTLYSDVFELAQHESVAPVERNVVNVHFSPTTAEFPNPERGFYRPAASGNLDTLTAHEVSEAFRKGYRLLYARIDLERYRESEIPESYLNDLHSAFDLARQGGVKLIIRATYNYPRGETEYRDAEDAPLSWVLAHIGQLEPVWRENADVISVVQAGFIGAWGEWHTSSNDLASAENRTRIRDALLEAVPETRFVQFRYPPYIMDWYPDLPDLNSALDGRYRTGFHNDCFLASATDVGTYSEDLGEQASQRHYTQALGDLAIFGGETCRPADSRDPVSRSACTDILREGAQYKLTYLNDSYYRGLFHENWRTEGCMDRVSRSMGYRFTLVEASHVSAARPGEEFELSFIIGNSGWARLYNPRSIEIVLRNRKSGMVRRLQAEGADPRSWLPYTEHAETVRVKLPDDLAKGTWQIMLALPDANDSISHDPRYAIRFANDDRINAGQAWDETLGAFALGTAVVIQ